MPTGYTADVANGKITTLRDFALLCARGMGALIAMRDEPLSAPVPDSLQPNTEYYDERLATARARLAELQAMTPEQIASAAAQWNAENEEQRAARGREHEAQRNRYDQMIAETRAWEGAPEGLKEFMLSQLVESKNFDCGHDPLAYYPTERTADEWYAAEIAEALRAIEYSTEQRNGEIDRTAKRNEWLAQLHRALPEG